MWLKTLITQPYAIPPKMKLYSFFYLTHANLFSLIYTDNRKTIQYSVFFEILCKKTLCLNLYSSCSRPLHPKKIQTIHMLFYWYLRSEDPSSRATSITTIGIIWQKVLFTIFKYKWFLWKLRNQDKLFLSFSSSSFCVLTLLCCNSNYFR
jgi:hypothetical protein